MSRPSLRPMRFKTKLTASTAKSRAGSQKPFVISHYELSFDLRNGIHCHTDKDQQGCAAKEELISKPCGYPAKPRCSRQEIIDIRSDERQSSHLESAKKQL